IGELCIRGPGVALGYVNREALTKEKFTEYGYRTGDRVSIQNGQIFFHERIDSQVKLRGFRMELDEIEQELLRLEGQVISAAVAVVHEQLIAFVVGNLTESQMREELRQRLPSYMVPDRLIKVDGAMPRLPSGKIDRKALLLIDDMKKPKLSKVEINSNIAVEHTINEPNGNSQPIDVVINTFQKSFPHQQVKPNNDFFLDLGGHSLIAALTIAELRKYFPSVALHDLYECKTATKLAERLTNQSIEKKNDESIAKPFAAYVKPSLTRIILCSIYQLLVMLILGTIASMELLLPYITFVLLLHEHDLGYACLVAYGTLVVTMIVRYSFPVLIKWILIGRYKEGDFPLWGWMYLRWWTVEQLRNLAMEGVLADSPLMSIYYRLLGARIGRNVHLGSISCAAPDLLEIDNETTISSEVHFQTAFVEDYTLKFRRICIDRYVYVGSRSVLNGQTKMNDYSELDDLSFLPSNTSVPTGEVWHGSPATYSHNVDIGALTYGTTKNKFKSLITPIIFTVIVVFFIPFFYFIPTIPGLILFEYVDLKSVNDWIEVFIFGVPVGILYT
ncbi:unnamed protein product, partial [Adineta ricciae]